MLRNQTVAQVHDAQSNPSPNQMNQHTEKENSLQNQKINAQINTAKKILNKIKQASY